MPPSSAVLAATIGMTFVGPKNLPQKTMPGFLHVNCHRVHDTLLWLKENNPVYRDIVISSSRLNDLPLDGILLEISLTAKHCDNAAQLAEERDGYVPEDMDGDESYPPIVDCDLDNDMSHAEDDNLDDSSCSHEGSACSLLYAFHFSDSSKKLQ